MKRDPRAVAGRLAGIYGRTVESPLMYPTGVAFLGRLRLGGPGSDAVEDIARLAEPLVAAPDSVVIQPRISHRVTVSGPVRLRIDFFRE